MKIDELKNVLGKVDVYLLDHVMKNRYSLSESILDVGCGKGRNLLFLHKLGFKISGCDKDKTVIDNLLKVNLKLELKISTVQNLLYPSNSFNHLICNAVLHFAKDDTHFYKMIDELYRVVRINGSVFIRMTSIFGIEKLVEKANNQYLLPDGTHRFLLEDRHIDYIKIKFDFLEPLKTVNVNNLRCMTTLMLTKK
jgi:ubiquinone/menaquinone biosynthesis C-methylase UbiE